MSRPSRFVLAAVLATLLAAGAAACDSGNAVDTTDGTRSAQSILGWSKVDPIAVTLPTGNPITDGSVLPAASEPVLVNVWASWCPPCKKELPLLQEVAASGRLKVVGFSRDRSEDNAAEALRKAGVTYPNWLDPDADVVDALDGRVPYASVPASFLIRDGQVVAVHIGEFKTEADVMKALEQ